MNTEISTRINSVYRNLIQFRNGQVWGHAPVTEEVFEFFESVKQYTGVNRILETGFNIGMSAATQLTVHPNATLHSYDPLDWGISNAIYDKGYRFPIRNYNASSLGKLVWGERLVFHRSKSARVVLDYEPNFFDYAFLDGDHTYEGLYADIENCKSMNIRYIIIDNLEKINEIAKVVEDYKGLTFIKDLQYVAVHPKFETEITDKLGLFELI